MNYSAERIVRLVANHLGAEQERVGPDAFFIDDLGADSLDVVELVMAIEEEFGLVIPDHDAEQLQSVGELIRYVEEALREKESEKQE